MQAREKAQDYIVRFNSLHNENVTSPEETRKRFKKYWTERLQAFYDKNKDKMDKFQSSVFIALVRAYTMRGILPYVNEAVLFVNACNKCYEEKGHKCIYVDTCIFKDVRKYAENRSAASAHIVEEASNG
jgi:hypothetical protein